MSKAPTKGRILDYGMRWGIEAIFSDFKSRDFGITQTHLKHTDHIESLILAIATYWAVSTGMKPIDSTTPPPKKAQRSFTSYFKKGLRILLSSALNLTLISVLWSYLTSVGW